MKLRRNLLKTSQLYLILDKPSLSSFSLEKISNLVSDSGIGLIQLRDKSSSKAGILKYALRLTRHLSLTKKLFIINDYADVALACGADGVHLGQDDLSVKRARKILGESKIIGLSCHSLSQALQAQQEGADYIGIGPIYTTATKPGCRSIGLEVLQELKNRIKIPYFAIGNIHRDNLKEVVAAGARRVAVCRAIFKASDAKQETKHIYKILKKYDTVGVR